MFYIVQYNGYCIIKLLEIQKYIKNVKDLKYGMVANYHTTNKCTNCMSFILNHFFKTLSLLLHIFR